MRLVSRKNMEKCWRDPLRHLRHHLFRNVYATHPGAQHQVEYATYCGLGVTVDDVNALSMISGMPTCLHCIVAPPIDDVLPTEE